MDDASLERVCVEFVAAGADRDRAARAVRVLSPVVHAQIRGLARDKANLFASGRIEPEDVGQEVLRRMIDSPLSNVSSRDPVATVLGWTRAVAIRFLIDRRRRNKAEAPLDPPDSERPQREVVSSERGADDELDVHKGVARMHAAAKELGRHKHLAEVYAVLVKDPDIPALDLVLRAGVVAPPDASAPEEERAAWRKKSTQHAWKLKQRVLDFLAEQLGAREDKER